ncbi:MAG: tRNA lysidine(34) synthetase TilS [Proteobacteria bacterium]|nr:tRNA lysidine(34) synthetase TilS [Pseudomonadota bacterium]
MHPLEHMVVRNFREVWGDFPLFKLDVLVSGGLDSIVLLEVLCRVQRLLKLDLRVLHLHHGSKSEKGSQGKQGQFRDQARRLVEEICRKKKISFLSVKSPVYLDTESECREFRRQWIDQVSQGRIVVTGHHLNDVLENDLIRLIRGTGPLGLVSFKMWNGKVLRPLLNLSREQIKSYAEEQALVWLEDPSNQEDRYLRNFLRKDWFPRLENYRKGSLSRLQKSLELIKESILETPQKGPLFSDFKGQEKVDMSWYQTLSVVEKRQFLAKYMLDTMKVRFSLSQIKEIQKHLDIPQKVHRFVVAGLVWQSNAGQFWAQKKPKNASEKLSIG